MGLLKIIGRRKVVVPGIILTLTVISGVWGVSKPLPAGISYRSEEYRTDNITFLLDLTYEKNGDRVSEQTIFKNIYEMIDNAQEYIIIDMFLFNESGANDSHLPISSDLTNKLTEKKQNNSEIDIVFITDPINTVYGAYDPEHIARLKKSGIKFIATDLRKLRDSNVIYSSIDRILLRFIRSSVFPPYLPNVFDTKGEKVRIENYLALLNFKANHRKTVTTEKETLITSANPHDASSLHTNFAFRIKGDFAKEVYKSEESVAIMSGEDIGTAINEERSVNNGLYSVTLITEKKIKEEIIRNIDASEKDSRMDIHMFYLSDRNVINAIKRASQRGVIINLVLDASKDSFGIEKNGIPNRQAGYELSKAGVSVRWYKTKGEQFHTKLLVFQNNDTMAVIGGSANLTRRNLENFNLETDVLVKAPMDSELAIEIGQYLQMISQNIGGVYTVDFEEYAEKSRLKWLVYMIQEATGLSTF